jgi:lipoic acid synthetase
MDASPDILNHNLETAERLYPMVRPGGRYPRALGLLASARRMSPKALTKSGVILGMGEEWDEVVTCMRDLRRSDVNILTLGQYLRPSPAHIPVARYYSPDEFTELGEIALALGFSHVQASPLTRSSYHAWEQARAAGSRPQTEGTLL